MQVMDERISLYCNSEQFSFIRYDKSLIYYHLIANYNTEDKARKLTKIDNSYPGGVRIGRAGANLQTLVFE